MRILLALVRKEFLQIARDPGTVIQILLIPVVQLLVLANAATFEVRNSRVLVVDEDRTARSVGLVARLEGNPDFRVARWDASAGQIEAALRRREAVLVVRIPDGFEAALVRGGAAEVQLQVSAEDGATAGVVQAGAQAIIADYAHEVVPAALAGRGAPRGALEVRTRRWFNPAGNYKHYMVPGLLVSLTTIIGMLLTAQNIVREKELGTLEQLNVTPVQRWQVIGSKLIPFWLIGLGIFSLGLVIARFVFHVPMVGSLGVVYVALIGYLLVALGLGLLLSTAAETQQQVMFFAFFIIMIFMLMSGLFTPIEGMPRWALWIADLTPVKHFVVVMRSVLLRGAGWQEVWPTIVGLYAAGVSVCAVAIARYRKGSA